VLKRFQAIVLIFTFIFSALANAIDLTLLLERFAGKSDPVEAF